MRYDPDRLPNDEVLESLRKKWKYRGDKRPPYAITPGPGEESVWDYPRPPRVELTNASVKVLFGSTVVAATSRAARVLETSTPPVYYIPPEDVRRDCLVKSGDSSLCEWKGVAIYLSLSINRRLVENVAWSYPNPAKGYGTIKDYLGFYPAKLLCYVDNELVRPQKLPFYGGWLSSNIVGPFKGDPEVVEE